MTVEIISWSISAKVWVQARIKLVTPGLPTVLRGLVLVIYNSFILFYNTKQVEEISKDQFILTLILSNYFIIYYKWKKFKRPFYLDFYNKQLFYYILQHKCKKYKIPVYIFYSYTIIVLYITKQVEEMQKTSLSRL